MSLGICCLPTITTLCVGDSHVKRLKQFVGVAQPASITFRIANLKEVNYYGLSGGLINNSHHLRLISDAVSHFRPQHLIVFLGGNDLNSNLAHFDTECVITRLLAYLTQLDTRFRLQTVTVLSVIPRNICRHITLEVYNRRVREANHLLRDLCANSKIKVWKLHGFMNSSKNILCDGVHLNPLGFHKLIRQIRGIFLTRGPSQ